MNYLDTSKRIRNEIETKKRLSGSFKESSTLDESNSFLSLPYERNELNERTALKLEEIVCRYRELGWIQYTQLVSTKIFISYVTNRTRFLITRCQNTHKPRLNLSKTQPWKSCNSCRKPRRHMEALYFRAGNFQRSKK